MADGAAAAAAPSLPRNSAHTAVEQVSGVNCADRPDVAGDSLAFFEAAQSLIKIAATGAAAPADSALPWPPPPYVSPARTAVEILSSAVYRHLGSRVLPVGCRAVDEYLNGGVPRSRVVEIAGKAGCGKTQFALSLVSETVLQSCFNERGGCSETRLCEPTARQPSAAGSALLSLTEHAADSPELAEAEKPTAVFYIHTEGGFPVQRLHEIMNSRRDLRARGGESSPARPPVAHAGVVNAGPLPVPPTKALMQRVFMEEVATEEELWITLTRRLPRLFLSYRVALIVIDSIAAVFRLPTASAEPPGAPDPWQGSESRKKVAGLVDRATKLMRIGAILRRFAATHGCCCLVLNQVSDTTSDEEGFDLSLSTASRAPASPRSPGGERPTADGPEGGTDQKGVPRATLSSPQCVWRSVSAGIDGELAWSSRQVAPRRLLFGGEDPGVRPALGLTWSNCVDCRMMIHRMEGRVRPVLDTARAEGEAPRSPTHGPLRCLRVVFGSGLDNATDTFFRIDAGGIADP
ncbi:putative DNA repair protein recA [Neospora caninum Liverpool]|uniref:DNA repair protein recA, putative n=1 Tax=Neospora caninum (strain Liverpool) TaxID=572307 RepID=F0V8D2_NEOCL|nr:putative DNA repair protein recA [Neospora caninum Liverpool]CBZ49973.1 putative DNA repair protein recA [Neospora caninum Liverpool]CEL64561.1 TPA: DNA repair protein recA, putative [Neospora caninum Liverpool]|eukprot:XP_003880008.1 putative DNA repair protein recA [Neospora caninum Liverpool]